MLYIPAMPFNIYMYLILETPSICFSLANINFENDGLKAKLQLFSGIRLFLYASVSIEIRNHTTIIN